MLRVRPAGERGARLVFAGPEPREMVLRRMRAGEREGSIMLRLVSQNETPVSVSWEDELRESVRAEIAQSKEPRLTATMVAEIILRKTGADMGALVTHGARLYLTGLAREELARSPRHALADKPEGSF